MSQTDKPLASSANTKTAVPFRDMPEEYAIVNREYADQYAGTAGLFAKLHDAQTLMVLYDDDGVTLRSVYQSPAVIRPEMREDWEKSREVFYHVYGEKLVSLTMDVCCDVAVYGRANVLVPQRASSEEVRGMASGRVQALSGQDDPFRLQEDWSTVDGLRINRVVEEVREPGMRYSHERVITQDVPVEFAPSNMGEGVYELLKSAERGTIIPPEVFMYATAMEAMKAGEEFESGFVEGLKSKAQLASENAVYRQMMETRQVSLSRDMMVLSVDTDDLKVYRAGSVLRGTPDNPVEYRVYQENQEKGGDASRVVLAGVTNKDVVIEGSDGSEVRIEKGAIHIIEKGLGTDGYLSPDFFNDTFLELDQPAADVAMVKHFGYRVNKEASLHTEPGCDIG